MSDELRGRRIMVVEDEGLILLTIRDMLEDLGCEIAVAESRFKPAVEAIGSTAIDAALLDVNLGHDETSYPIADALAARGIPFAFLTGYGSDGLRAGYEGCRVLSKPIEDRSLESALRSLLKSARPVAT